METVFSLPYLSMAAFGENRASSTRQALNTFISQHRDQQYYTDLRAGPDGWEERLRYYNTEGIFGTDAHFRAFVSLHPQFQVTVWEEAL